MTKVLNNQAPETDSPALSLALAPAPGEDSSAAEGVAPPAPALPDTYTPRPYDGTLRVATLPGYVASFWRFAPLDMTRGRDAGVYFPKISEGFFAEPELLTPSTEGFALVGDLVVGVEKATHYQQRKAAEARKATAFLDGLKRAAGQKDAGNPNAAYLARFTQTVEERELPGVGEEKDEG